jgi:hypothetical protein
MNKHIVKHTGLMNKHIVKHIVVYRYCNSNVFWDGNYRDK